MIKAYHRMQQAFPGTALPANVVVKAPSVRTPAARAAIAQLERRALASGRAFEPITVDVNRAGTVANITVPIAGNGTDAASNAAFRDLRDTIVPETVGALPGAQAGVTGRTAEWKDQAAELKSNLAPVVGFVLLFAFVLMLVAFRSIVVAAKAILLNLLSVAAAYGVLVLVFQHGVGKGLLGVSSADGIETVVPLLLFVILFGLSMDYHVFILSRIRETFDRGETMDDAVAHGIKSTAGVVTSAAIVMVCVFAVFGALSMPFFKQFGVGLAAAILIDATIVRGVLLPATMKLLGDWNWYLPSWLEWLPRLEPRGGGAGGAGSRLLAAEAAGEHLVQRPRVEHVRRPGASAPGRRHREVDVLEPARRVGVGRADDRDAGLPREADVLVAQVEPGRQPVHLDRAALLGEPGEDGLEVDRVRRAVVDQPPGRVAEAADVGRVERGQHALRQLLARAALAAVDARLHPVELGQQVVGEVERAVAADVALGPAQEAERRELLVGGRDLLGLAAHAVGVEPGDGADADRVVADRQVLVAALAGGDGPSRGSIALPSDQVEWQCRSPRICATSTSSVAWGAPASRSSGGTNGRPSAAKTPSSSGASGSGSCAATHSGEPVARTSSVPRRAGSATTSSTGTPSTVTPSARRSPRSTTATICGSASNRSSTDRSPGDDDREPLRRVAPAARVAGRDPAERLGDRLDERPAAVQQQRRRCCGLRFSRQRRAQLALGLGPDPRHLLQPSGLGRLAQLRERADAEHASDLEHALDRDAEEAPEPGELRRDLALELLQLGDLAGLDQLDAAAARSPARSRAARGRGPGARARRPAPASSGSGRPRGGRPATCTSPRPPARAARRTGRARAAISALSGGDPCTAG